MRIQGPGEGGFKSCQVGATFDGIDGVGEREECFIVTIVVLESHLNLDIVSFSLDVNWLVVQDVLVLVEVLNEVDNSAFIVKPQFLVGAQILNINHQSSVEKSQFSHALSQCLKAELQCFKHLRIWLESDLRSPLFRLARFPERSHWNAALVTLAIDLAVTPNLQVQSLRQGIHH